MRAPGALCYVRTNPEPPGTRTCSAYTSRARMIVLRDVDGGVGDWAAGKRDLAVDTDQTGESVTA